MKQVLSNKTFLFVILSLVFFGLVMILDASAAYAARTFGDKFFYVKRQLMWLAIGLPTLFLFSRLKYTFWQKLALPFFVFSLVLLVLVPFFGVSALGATRRIDVGILGIQPAELVKLSLILYLATLAKEGISFARFIVPVLAVLLLVILEPDMGTASIIGFTSLVIYFVSGAPFLYFFGMGLLALFSGIILALTSSYRKERILTFLNPNFSPLDVSYHVRQVLIALGSGGLFGLGFGQSRQKHLFLPEPATDSIFAIIGEELGFIGSFLVIFLFFLLIFKGLQIARTAQDEFGRLVTVGIISWFGIQSLVNLGAMVAILPLTGIPLPFVSYGGSSLVVSLAACGIVLNISQYQKKMPRRLHGQ